MVVFSESMAVADGASTSCNRRKSRANVSNSIADSSSIEDEDLRGFVIRIYDGIGKQIRFPERFTARWGYLIDQEVILTTNDRQRHLIKVERRTGNIWLGCGWQEFVQQYNLQGLDVLYFRRKRNDMFNVVMCNVTGLEYRKKRESQINLPVSFCKQMVSRRYVNRMVVPEDFYIKYGLGVQNPTTFVGPDKVERTVECASMDNPLCFADGWNEFALNYNIKRMDFVCVKVWHTMQDDIEYVKQTINLWWHMFK